MKHLLKCAPTILSSILVAALHLVPHCVDIASAAQQNQFEKQADPPSSIEMPQQFAARLTVLHDLERDLLAAIENDQATAETPAISPASTVYLRFRQVFSTPPQSEGTSPEAQEEFRRLYSERAKLLLDGVSATVRTASTREPAQLHRLVGLCTVVRWLHATDESWTPGLASESLREFPEQEAPAAVARAALEAGIPRIAWDYHKLWLERTKKPEEIAHIFWFNSAEELATRGQLEAATACLVAAASDPASPMHTQARQRMASHLAELGRHDEAAEALAPLLKTERDAEARGSIAVDRVRQFLLASKFREAAEIGLLYAQDEAMLTHRPQLIYASWIAHRHIGDRSGASLLVERFISEFPNHALGADLRFSAALDRIAGGDLESARRLLEEVQFRYPDFQMMDQVKSIRASLGTSAKP